MLKYFECRPFYSNTLGLTAHIYSGTSFLIYLIDAGYQLVYIVAIGVILTTWR